MLPGRRSSARGHRKRLPPQLHARGIAAVPGFAAVLAFKGGTALKKCAFGEYRFSEDLDFSGMNAPTGESLEQALRAAIAARV